MAFDFSTLVTDRTQADVAYARQLAEKLVTGTATEAEIAEWNSFTLKGVYNHTDLNRVTAAMEDLKLRLEGYGYAVPGYQRIEVPHPVTGGGSRLPEGYLELTYIESTGTQYIDTGFKPNSNTRIVADMEITSGTTSFLFGARHNSSANATSYSFSMVQISGASLRSDFGSVETTVSVSPVQRLAIDKNGNTTTVNGTTVTATAQSFSGSYNLALFTVNTAGTINSTKTSAKLYSCQIYDNGTLVRDFVPCKNSGGVFGLYDLANDVFYHNAGSGTFAAGEEVVAPATASVMVASSDLNEYDPYTWYEFDWPTPKTMTIYLLNVSAIRAVLAVMKSTPSVPVDMVILMARDANDIEAILLDVYRQLTIMPTTFIPCGEALCGGDNL